MSDSRRILNAGKGPPHPNPREDEINYEWDKILPDLVVLNGRGASETMATLYEKDRRLWNACYWRIDQWLVGFFARKPMTEEETGLEYGRLEAGRMRFDAWLHSKYGMRSHGWRTQDLKFMLQELKAEGTHDKPHVTGAE